MCTLYCRCSSHGCGGKHRSWIMHVDGRGRASGRGNACGGGQGLSSAASVVWLTLAPDRLATRGAWNSDRESAEAATGKDNCLVSRVAGATLRSSCYAPPWVVAPCPATHLCLIASALDQRRCSKPSSRPDMAVARQLAGVKPSRQLVARAVAWPTRFLARARMHCRSSQFLSLRAATAGLPASRPEQRP